MPGDLVHVTSEAKTPSVLEDKSLIWKLVSKNDLKGLSPEQKLAYTIALCKSLGIDPSFAPFQLIEFDGKEHLYATKSCTEQLRKVHKVSLRVINEGWLDEEKTLYQVRVEAWTPDGRRDTGVGVVPVEGKDDKRPKAWVLANIPMKAETKAKRRATLSICGLGFLDESELETVRGAPVRPIREDQADQLGKLAETNPAVLENMKGYGVKKISDLTADQADSILILVQD